MACVRADIRKCRPKGIIKSLFEYIDLSWDTEEIIQAKKLYNNGVEFERLVEILRPHEINKEAAKLEVLLLYIELSHLGRIKERPGGLLGNEGPKSKMD